MQGFILVAITAAEKCTFNSRLDVNCDVTDRQTKRLKVELIYRKQIYAGALKPVLLYYA